MAITQVNGTTTASVQSSTTLTINKPTSVAAGDLLTAVLTSDSTVPTAPSGWTKFGGGVHSTASWQNNLYYRVVTGSEGASFSWTVGNVGPAAGCIHAWRGVDTSSPIAAIQTADQGADATEGLATPNLNVSPVANGRLFYVRNVRWGSAGGAGTAADLTEAALDVSRRASVGNVSTSGNTAYTVGSFSNDNNYSGVATYNGVEISCDIPETENFTATYALKALATPASGGFTITAGHVTASGAGSVHNDGVLSAQLGHASLNFNAEHFPPGFGIMDVQLPNVGMDFEAEGVGGPASVTLKNALVGFAGSVNPIGGFGVQLNSVVIELVGETRPFGAQVIFVEPEKRGLRITQDDTTPIYASEVTQE